MWRCDSGQTPSRRQFALESKMEEESIRVFGPVPISQIRTVSLLLSDSRDEKGFPMNEIGKFSLNSDMSEPVSGRLASESYTLVTELPLPLGEINPLEDGPWWVYGEVRSSDPNTLGGGTKVAMRVYTNKLNHGWSLRQDITEEEYKILYILRGGDNPGKDTPVKAVEYVDDTQAAWMSGWARNYMDFPPADEGINLRISWRDGSEQADELSLTIKHRFSGKSLNVPLTVSVKSIPIMAWEYAEPIRAIEAFEHSALIGRMLSVLSGKQESNARISAMDENDDYITFSQRHVTTLENNCDYLLAWPILGKNLPEYGHNVSLEDLRSYFKGVFKSERRQYAVGLMYEAAYLSVLQGSACMLILSAAEEIYRESLQAPTQKTGLRDPLQYLFGQVNERLNLSMNFNRLIDRVVRYRNNHLGHRQRGMIPDEQVILEYMRLIHKAIMVVLLGVRESGMAYEHYRQRFMSLVSNSESVVSENTVSSP